MAEPIQKSQFWNSLATAILGGTVVFISMTVGDLIILLRENDWTIYWLLNNNWIASRIYVFIMLTATLTFCIIIFRIIAKNEMSEWNF